MIDDIIGILHDPAHAALPHNQITVRSAYDTLFRDDGRSMYAEYVVTILVVWVHKSIPEDWWAKLHAIRGSAAEIGGFGDWGTRAFLDQVRILRSCGPVHIVRQQGHPPPLPVRLPTPTP